MRERAEADLAAIQWLLISGFASALGLALLVALFAARSIRRPVQALTQATSGLAAGKLDAAVPGA